MAQDKQHINYTAEDIARYHRGELSSGERHAMERAALDDPFLADAMEGYLVPGVDAAVHMNLLHQRLANRLEDEKQKTPVVALPRKGFQWWKVAAMILLVAGAGYLVYLFTLTNDSDESTLAIESRETKQESAVVTERADSQVANNKTEILPATGDTSGNVAKSDPHPSAKNQTQLSPVAPAAADQRADEYKTSNPPAATPVAEPPKAKEEVSAEVVKQAEKKAARDQVQHSQQQDDKAAAFQRRAAEGKAKAVSDMNVQNRANVFRGRVMDAQNQALPFANITNEADNVGTYTDARGYFVLTSPDSVLNVQVRSLGFENSRIQLSNERSNNLVLQEDKSINETVLSRSQANATRSRTGNMLFEEPEPADGWSNYDAYIANNLNIPDAYLRQRNNRLTGVVEVSFEVDEMGNPVNIKVEKSLCDSCDKEAIRLVKDGPKWKRKAKKKGRTTVTIPF